MDYNFPTWANSVPVPSYFSLDAMREQFERLKEALAPPPGDYVQVKADWLPKTVKDKEGREVELLAVFVDRNALARAFDPAGFFDPQGVQPASVFFVTGEEARG